MVGGYSSAVGGYHSRVVGGYSVWLEVTQVCLEATQCDWPSVGYGGFHRLYHMAYWCPQERRDCRVREQAGRRWRAPAGTGHIDGHSGVAF